MLKSALILFLWRVLKLFCYGDFVDFKSLEFVDFYFESFLCVTIYFRLIFMESFKTFCYGDFVDFKSLEFVGFYFESSLCVTIYFHLIFM